MKDIVVILPGITGSVLRRGGKDLWNISGQAIGQFLKTRGRIFQQLKLQGADSGGIYYEDGIRATSLVTDAQIIPGLIKIVDGYTQTSSLITDNFEVISGNIYRDSEDKAANFYHFPYDWRRDNRINGKILQKLVNQRLKTWREFSGYSDAKVILLAHSMGGLVSRYYLEVLGGWQDCRALFTFGTPYRGSVNVVNFLANGLKKAFIDLTDFVRSLPSVYQLLPIYSMVEMGDEHKRIAEIANLPNIEQTKAQDALAFHREIESAVNTNRKEEKYHRSFATVPFVGVQQPTLQSAEFQKGKLTTSKELPKIMRGLDRLANGDGTVPQISAFPIEFSDRDVLEIPTFIAEKHGALQSQSDILLDLLNKLQIAESAGKTIEDIRGRGDGKERSIEKIKGISLDVEDIYFQDREISIKARVNPDNEEFELLQAQIECLSQDWETLNLNLVREGAEFVLQPDSLNLPPGLYRVRVQTSNTTKNSPNPVNDLFEVTDII